MTDTSPTLLSCPELTMGQQQIAGVNIVVTTLATLLPDGKPLTEDMRNMVDHLSALGLIQRKPAVFTIKDAYGGETIHMHPVLHEQLQVQLKRQAMAMEREFDRRIMGIYSHD